MDNFVRKYALSKTLRFELKPVGETAEKIEDFKNKTIASIVEQDKKRAQDYKKIKKIIDDYHRYFIEQVLGQEILTGTDIKKASDAYNALKATPKDKDKREQFNNIQGNLRTKIAKAFKEQSGKYCLFDAGLLNEKGTGKNKTKGILWLWLKHRLDNKQINQSEFEEAEKLIKSFDKFYTYFKGFNENRQNMYSPEGKQTAISNRIINENMVKHFNNCRNFQEIQNNYKDLAEQLKDYEGIFIPAIFNQLMNQTGITKYNRIIGREPGKNYDEGVNQIINKYRQDKNIEHRQLPIMTALYKQILSDVEDKFKIDVFENPKQMSSTIAAFYNELFIKEKILHKFQKCFKTGALCASLFSTGLNGALLL